MRSTLKITLLAVISAVYFIGCEGDYRQMAVGANAEILVVMDSTKAAQSATALAIRETYGAPLMTIPRRSAQYDLRFRLLNTNRQLENIQQHRNIIFAATLDEDSNVGQYVRAILSEAVKDRIRSGDLLQIPLRDRWAQDQWVMIYVGNDDETLAQHIRKNAGKSIKELHELEMPRWRRYIYRRAEQVQLAQNIMDAYGWSFRIQHDYRLGVDTLNFVTLRRFTHDNDRWIWVWWQDDVASIDHIDKEWINTTRDSLNQHYMRGSRDSSFVTTEYREPMSFRDDLVINGKQTFETLGLWRMEFDLMGGPFVNYVMYDEQHQRLYMMEYGQFAPRWNKRNFVYQFQAMARTFISDPSAARKNEEEDEISI